MRRVKLQITLPEELKKKVLDASSKNEQSTSYWIELAIKRYLEENKENRPLIDLGI